MVELESANTTGDCWVQDRCLALEGGASLNPLWLMFVLHPWSSGSLIFFIFFLSTVMKKVCAEPMIAFGISFSYSRGFCPFGLGVQVAQSSVFGSLERRGNETLRE